MLASIALFSLVPLAFAQGATVNTPTGLTTCQPSLITFTGGVPPYFLTVLPGSQPAAAPLLTLLSNSVATSFTWNVNLAAGTSITLAIKDSTGAINYSQAANIAAGPSTACVGVPLSAVAGASVATTAGAGAPTVAGATTARTTGAASGTPAPGTTAGSTPASSGAAAATTSAARTSGSTQLTSVGLIGLAVVGMMV